jgi:hypothetical protein
MNKRMRSGYAGMEVGSLCWCCKRWFISTSHHWKVSKICSERKSNELEQQQTDPQAGTAQDSTHSDPSALNTACTTDEPGCNISKLQKLELQSCMQWRKKATDSVVNTIKGDFVAHNQLREEQLLELVAAHIRSVLEGHQVFEPVDHEELKVVLQMGMKTFSGVSTEAQENKLRSQEYPHVQPIKRILRAGTSELPELSCYDVPVDKQVLLQWKTQPHCMQKQLRFLQEKVEQQRAVQQMIKDCDNGQPDWEIDDVYTAINGLRHPHLGKSEHWMGFNFYADGIDVVNAIGVWAGKHKVVVMLAENLVGR